MMMKLSALGLTLAALAAAPADAQQIEVRPISARPSEVGSTQLFTGSAVIDPLFEKPSRAREAQVTFAPGARTAWHSHPAGQTLIVTSGTGWVQEWNGQRHEIRPGDVIWTPPGVKHWHGATNANGMSHIAIQQAVGGQVVQWMEHVTDQQYRAVPGATQ